MKYNKFLKQINRMSSKGKIPSLNILLEEKGDKEDKGEDEDLFDFDEEEGEEAEGGEGDSEAADEESIVGDADDSEEDTEADDHSGVLSDIDMIQRGITTLRGESDPHDIIRELGLEPLAASYDPRKASLKQFLLMTEVGEEKKLDDALDGMEDVLQKKEDEIDLLSKHAQKIQKGDPLIKNKLSEYALDALNATQKALAKPSVIPTYVATEMLVTIIKESAENDKKENAANFLEIFAELLDKKNIEHVLPVNKIEDTNYNNASGASSVGKT
jgi:hypothetical protein